MANLSHEERSKFETLKRVTAFPHQCSTLNENSAPNSKVGLTTQAGTECAAGTPDSLAAAFKLIGMSALSLLQWQSESIWLVQVWRLTDKVSKNICDKMLLKKKINV